MSSMKVNDLDTLHTRSLWGSSQQVHFKVTQMTRQWMGRPHLWRPPTDLYEVENNFVVRVEIAGMKDGELTISVEGRLLAVYGIRPHAALQAAFHQMEVRFGEFLSLVELPGMVDVEGINAEYDDGFLIVTLPKADR